VTIIIPMIDVFNNLAEVVNFHPPRSNVAAYRCAAAGGQTRSQLQASQAPPMLST
jgi:hypothetical protein